MTVRHMKDRCELLWTPTAMPFKYGSAPVLVRNSGDSDFPMLKDMMEGTLRSTLEGGFSSSFRTRTLPLVEQVALELVAVYESRRKGAPAHSICETYDEAFSNPPPLSDRHRKTTYLSLISAGSKRAASGCPNA
jgi:hypothetical protein